MPVGTNGHSPVITIGVFAALAYDITSANLSSPQTFELNVNQREGTLSKWLNMNVAEAIVWGTGASILDKTWNPVIGVLLGIASMYCKYQYAIRSGKQKGMPDMENPDTQGYNLGNGGGYLWLSRERGKPATFTTIPAPRYDGGAESTPFTSFTAARPNG